MKVITITSHINLVKERTTYFAQEYPELNTYLEEGYVIKETIYHAPKNQSTHFGYSITFILDKS